MSNKMSNKMTKQPKSLPAPVLEGHLIVHTTGSLVGDRRAMKLLQATVKEAVKATGLAADPHFSIRRLLA